MFRLDESRPTGESDDASKDAQTATMLCSCSRMLEGLGHILLHPHCSVFDLLTQTAYLCRLDESHLTGESDDVLKDADTAPMLCSGSRVLEGLGRCLVVAVGPNSQQGQISSMVAGVETSGDELRCASVNRCLSVKRDRHTWKALLLVDLHHGRHMPVRRPAKSRCF